MAVTFFNRKKVLYLGLIFLFTLLFILILKNILQVNVSNVYLDDDRAYEREICSKRHVQSRGAYCIDKDTIFYGGSNSIDGKVCRGIEELIGHSSLADFGAGLGQYGRCLLRKLPEVIDSNDKLYKKFYDKILEQMQNNELRFKNQVIKSWEGFDGGVNAEELSENLVRRVDLSKPFNIGKTFDWVMSLEVGEHIPSQFEDIFIDNIINHAKKGVIISWAVPKQGGSNHINERPNEYIINKFLNRGFSHDQKSQTLLRKNSTFWYFKNTIMVFRPV